MSHYQNLGLPENASHDSVKKAYRTLAKKYHPDRNKRADAASKFISINDSYEWILSGKGDQALNTYKYYAQPEQPKGNPVNEFDLNGDGKLSQDEWRKMQKHKYDEAARAFYNQHQTSIDFLIRLSFIYIFLFGFSGLILWGGIELIDYMLHPDPEEDLQSPGFLVLSIIFLTFSLPMIVTLSGFWGISDYKIYIKIIRIKWDPKFKTLGVFWF